MPAETDITYEEEVVMRIVKDIPKEVPTMSVANAIGCVGDKVICYIPVRHDMRASKSIAILQPNYKGEKLSYGWRYLDNLLLGTYSNEYKYEHSTAADSIQAVVHGGRQVMVFDDTNDLIQYLYNI